jgi:hypothetical protein
MQQGSPKTKSLDFFVQLKRMIIRLNGLLSVY